MMRQKHAFLAAACVLLLTACSSGAGTASNGSGQPAGSPTAATAAAADAASDPGTTGSAPASPLEGVWHTKTITADDTRATLTAAGLQKWIQPLMQLGGGSDATYVGTLRVLNDRWILYWSENGGQAEEIDSGRYVIDADSVTITHGTEGSDTFGWSIDSSTLTLTYVSDTIPASDGIPEKVYQIALYQSSPWMAGQP
jgi:hypothetical protein